MRGGAQTLDVVHTPYPVPPPRRAESAPSARRGRERKNKRKPFEAERASRQSSVASRRRWGRARSIWRRATPIAAMIARASPALAALAERCATPLVATGDVLYHAPHRRAAAGRADLRARGHDDRRGGPQARGQRRAPLEGPARDGAPVQGLRGGRRAHASRSRRPAASRSTSSSTSIPTSRCRRARPRRRIWRTSPGRARAGAFPTASPSKVHALITRELELIGELNYAPYFLTVHDIVRFARAQDILCQGRGSAANSAVCYCLAITAVNPTEIDLLFERFVSPERKEPPDIDVDFEHERREEVIQYIYARYGRDRAGLAATVISYRARSAVRDVGKAMGLSEDTVSALAGMVWGTRCGRRAAGEARARGGPRSGRSAARDRAGAGAGTDGLSAASVAARRRLRADARAPRRGRARRQRGHGRPHLHRVGQGRHRRARAFEGRRAGARHAHLHPQGLRSHRAAPRPGDDARQRPARGRGRLRHAVQGRIRSACSRSRAARR